MATFDDRDLLKSKAEKLAKALRNMNCCGLVGCSEEKHRARCPEGIAKEALAEFDKGK